MSRSKILGRIESILDANRKHHRRAAMVYSRQNSTVANEAREHARKRAEEIRSLQSLMQEHRRMKEALETIVDMPQAVPYPEDAAGYMLDEAENVLEEVQDG